MQNSTNNYYEYLAIDEKDILWDLYITGIGYCRIPPNSPYPPQGHPGIYNFTWQKGRILPEYQIVIVSEGKGSFQTMETGMIEFTAPAVFILYPGIWHRYCPSPETGWTEHWISLNGEFLYRLARRDIISPEEAFKQECNINELTNIHHKIWDHLHNTINENSPVLTAYGLEIVANIVESTKRHSKAIENKHPDIHATDPIVAQALHIIWSHSHRNISVEEIVKQLPVTRRTLERKFNEYRGHCIGRELLLCRLARAKHMLANTSLPIEHIALATGFSGADRLGKTIRQFENTTPSDYRKRFKQK